jgi:AraC-like DNA-binding protein
LALTPVRVAGQPCAAGYSFNTRVAPAHQTRGLGTRLMRAGAEWLERQGCRYVTGLIGISKDLAAPVSREDVPPEVARVLRHLESAYDDPVSPSSLARKAGMTAARFARVIKRIHGISPMQLITKTRITAGCRFLCESDASVAQIALNCGFADHSAFTRAFRAVTGCSPSEYRRLNFPSVARATVRRAHTGT